jgi:hypothetical protein
MSKSSASSWGWGIGLAVAAMLATVGYVMSGNSDEFSSYDLASGKGNSKGKTKRRSHKKRKHSKRTR